MVGPGFKALVRSTALRPHGGCLRLADVGRDWTRWPGPASLRLGPWAPCPCLGLSRAGWVGSPQGTGFLREAGGLCLVPGSRHSRARGLSCHQDLVHCPLGREPAAQAGPGQLEREDPAFAPQWDWHCEPGAV